MPNTSSAIKALRQSKKKKAANLRVTRSYKDTVKTFKKLLKEGKTSEAKKALALVYKKLDKATKKGVIKKNKASRLKSSAQKAVK